MTKPAELNELIAPAVEAVGYQLWGLVIIPGKQRLTLRVYIDNDKGIDVDDCARASHQISGVLELHDPIRGEYILEVSSPGFDRPLFTLAQYQRYIGSIIKLTLHIAQEGRRRFRGQLQKIEGDNLLIEQDGQPVTIPFAHIEKANVVPDFDQ